ncbi:MAG: glycoside hydrolase family 3 N-terminal domain-containing protein [Actinomyces urogenitalis]|uniref:glycoside hydrolase family 3 protein n=1 Tax=Actinomyces urogenitalis TaxID=103621 RepID=UPI002A83ED35|nr:glycoside hydrolase family 3 N-terminal domain-containing protein [Actinomyces urogenitalis]MDY3678344.1 glycoside hydrolase family 3 N-terminal domain-containing protein [Actinomyces urogenitalis]
MTPPSSPTVPAPPLATAEQEAQVEAVLAGLTLRQKIGQLNQRLLGWQAVERDTRGHWRASRLLLDELERWEGLGALYGLLRADAWSARHWDNGIRPEERLEAIDAVRHAVAEHSPHGVGTLLVEEAPHGHQALGGTLLPTNLAQAATWDVEAVEEASAAVGAEMAASELDIALVSGLDVLRDGRWGRSEETFGEDPALGAALAAALVRGMQGPARSRLTGARRQGVGVVIKHLAAQGEAMGGRNGRSALIGARDLAHTHLRSVRAAVEAGVVGVMAAYNDVDGVPCCANPWLLRDYLRGQLGFDGLVMADGLAVDRLERLGLDAPGCGRLALTSGVEMSLWDEGFTRLEELADDEAVLRTIDDACRRVLRLKARLGRLGEQNRLGGQVGTGSPQAEVSDLSRRGTELIRLVEAARRRTRQASRVLAGRCLVLLKDDGVLPLTGPGGLLVAGALATEHTAMLGDYVPPLPPDEQVSIAQALATAVAPRTVQVARDLPHWQTLTQELPAAGPRLRESVAATVVVVGGTSHRSYEDSFDSNGAVRLAGSQEATAATCGEGVDLVDLELPEEQLELLRAGVALREAGGPPVVVVVVAGRPHVLTEVLQKADAVVWAGYPGPFGGEAIARALTGQAGLTGRLPMLLPRATGVLPTHHDDRWSARDVYRDCPDPVLVPFAAGGASSADSHPALSCEAVEGGRLRVDITAQAGDEHREVLVLLGRRDGGAVVPRCEETLAFTTTVPQAAGVVRWQVELPADVVETDEGRLREIWLAPRHAGEEPERLRVG